MGRGGSVPPHASAGRLYGAPGPASEASARLAGCGGVKTLLGGAFGAAQGKAERHRVGAAPAAREGAAMSLPVHDQTHCLVCGKPSSVVLCAECRHSYVRDGVIQRLWWLLALGVPASLLVGFAGGIAVMWPALAWVCR